MTTNSVRRRFAGAALGLGLMAGLTTPLAAPAAAAGPCGAGASANAKWVQYVYGKILNRCAEPSAEAHWAGLISSGLAKRSDISRRIDMSDENLSRNNVIPIYQDTVGRTPDAQEIAHWVASMRVSQEDARLASLLMASDEFYVHQSFPDPCGFNPGAAARKANVTAVTHTPDETWVYNAYCSSLDRVPTADELAAGLTAIGSPSTADKRYTLIHALKYSEENAASWVGGVYGYGLERNPSDLEIGVGIPYLINVLKWHTFELFTRVLASDEAFAHAQLPPMPPPPAPALRASLRAFVRTH